MSFAVAMEYVELNPVMKVPLPALASRERVAPTVEETARILLAAEKADPDMLAYLWVAAEVGARRGETLALRWRDVDAVNGRITIERAISMGDDGVRERPRTKSGSARTAAISSVTLRHMLDLRSRSEALLSMAAGAPTAVSPDALVFSGGTGSRRTPFDGKPWRPDSTTRRFRKVKAAAQVRDEIDLHGLRHTMITELLAAGVDPRTVMGRAGHRSETTTMTVYAKVRPVVDAAAAELWGRMLEEKLRAVRHASGAATGCDGPEWRPG
jgi:integrase